MFISIITIPQWKVIKHTNMRCTVYSWLVARAWRKAIGHVGENSDCTLTQALIMLKIYVQTPLMVLEKFDFMTASFNGFWALIFRGKGHILTVIA